MSSPPPIQSALVAWNNLTSSQATAESFSQASAQIDCQHHSTHKEYCLHTTVLNDKEKFPNFFFNALRWKHQNSIEFCLNLLPLMLQHNDIWNGNEKKIFPLLFPLRMQYPQQIYYALSFLPGCQSSFDVRTVSRSADIPNILSDAAQHVGRCFTFFPLAAIYDTPKCLDPNVVFEWIHEVWNPSHPHYSRFPLSPFQEQEQVIPLLFPCFKTYLGTLDDQTLKKRLPIYLNFAIYLESDYPHQQFLPYLMGLIPKKSWHHLLRDPHLDFHPVYEDLPTLPRAMVPIVEEYDDRLRSVAFTDAVCYQGFDTSSWEGCKELLALYQMGTELHLHHLLDAVMDHLESLTRSNEIHAESYDTVKQLYKCAKPAHHQRIFTCLICIAIKVATAKEKKLDEWTKIKTLLDAIQDPPPLRLQQLIAMLSATSGELPRTLDTIRLSEVHRPQLEPISKLKITSLDIRGCENTEYPLKELHTHFRSIRNLEINGLSPYTGIQEFVSLFSLTAFAPNATFFDQIGKLSPTQLTLYNAEKLPETLNRSLNKLSLYNSSTTDLDRVLPTLENLDELVLVDTAITKELIYQIFAIDALLSLTLVPKNQQDKKKLIPALTGCHTIKQLVLGNYQLDEKDCQRIFEHKKLKSFGLLRQPMPDGILTLLTNHPLKHLTLCEPTFSPTCMAAIAKLNLRSLHLTIQPQFLAKLPRIPTLHIHLLTPVPSVETDYWINHFSAKGCTLTFSSV